MVICKPPGPFTAKMQAAGVPAEMVPHVWALLCLGADRNKLIRALGHLPRGRPKRLKPQAKRGAPPSNTIPLGDLDLFVRVVRADGITSGRITSDRGAIRAFLELYATEHGCRSLRTLAARQPARQGRAVTPNELVASMQQRLSRWRALHKSA